jgi:hypothetical protein
LSVEREGAILRSVRLDGIEILRGIYVAIRDETWLTLPSAVYRLYVEAERRSFRIHIGARVVHASIALSWEVRINANDGTLAVDFEAEALSSFRYGRIGLNVLHPVSFAGNEYVAHGPQGPRSARFPTAIAQQTMQDGILRPLIAPFHRLDLAGPCDVSFQLAFEGTRFETEDQRNWTDASFKTYPTPPSLGHPQEAAAGDRIVQSVVLVPAEHG